MEANLPIEYVAIDVITPNAYNPNVQDEDILELLRKSISEDGFTQPILIGLDNVIIDGFHRWKVAKELGFSRIPAVRIDKNDIQKKIATLRHNRARGKEDIGLLSNMFKELESINSIQIVTEALNMDLSEVDEILGRTPDLEIPDSEPAAPKPRQDERQTISITLSYTADEWEIIKKATGPDISEGLLSICKDYAGRLQA